MFFSHTLTISVGFLHLTGAVNSPVQSSREIRIATAVFPTLSLLNHSCCPNTSLVFSTGTSSAPSGSDLAADFGENVAECRSEARGVTVTIRAAKDITAGQEILHCYGKKRIMNVCMKQNHFDSRTLEICNIKTDQTLTFFYHTNMICFVIQYL